MLDTEETVDQSLPQQLRRVIKDGVDYLGSVISVVQARAAELALSSLVFASLLVFASILSLAALVLLVVALGFWLTAVTGHVGWALLIIGGLMAALAAASVWRALRWLKTLQS